MSQPGGGNQLQLMEKKQEKMSDQAKATRLLGQGRTALQKIMPQDCKTLSGNFGIYCQRKQLRKQNAVLEATLFLTIFRRERTRTTIIRTARATLDAYFVKIRLARATELALSKRFAEAEAVLSPNGELTDNPSELDLLARIAAQQEQLASPAIVGGRAPCVASGGGIFPMS